MAQIGTNGDDPETGFNNSDPVIYGLDGDDFIHYTGLGETYIEGGRGNDTIIGNIRIDTIYGGDGNDLIRGEGGADRLYGGEGNDTIFVSGTFLIGRGDFGGTTYAGPAMAFGGNGDDVITGDGTVNLFGDGGNDTIFGGPGLAYIDGGTGDDIIYAGGSSDSPGTAVTIALGGDGNDVIYGMNAGLLYGGNGSDAYEVTSGRTMIFETSSLPGEGPDKVFAYVDFTLPEHVENLIMTYGRQTYGYGNGEANIIVGNASNNVLEGKGGYDTLTGGAGSDLFIVNPNWGVDVITDFVAGAGTQDAVVFSRSIFSTFEQVIANSRQVGGDVWIGDGAGNTVVLENVALAALHFDDFGFI